MNQFKAIVSRFGAKLLRYCLAIVVSGGPVVLWAREAPLDPRHPKVQKALAAQAQLTPELMQQLPDVLGTAISLSETGEPELMVFVDWDGRGVAHVLGALPPSWRGVGIRVHLTDKFRALKGKPGQGVSHSAPQTPPIQLGTSGGWGLDLANRYCCGGTLGALLQVNGIRYILGNYHVFEGDIVPGGNGLVAQDGDPVIQPGLLDVGCEFSRAQIVGGLVKLNALPEGNVDCSVALAAEGMLRPDGAILGIGTLSTNTAAAFLNQPVKKSGRTTGLTRSKVSALNATVRVLYQAECAGATAFTKTFTGQIVVANPGAKFMAPGDSGSVLVEDVPVKPRAVGLLYAGSSTSAIANPIQEVLEFVGSKLGGPATIVGAGD